MCMFIDCATSAVLIHCLDNICLKGTCPFLFRLVGVLEDLSSRNVCVPLEIFDYSHCRLSLSYLRSFLFVRHQHV